MLDPTDGCFHCGVLDQNHAEDCKTGKEIARDKVKAEFRAARKQRLTWNRISGCESVPSGNMNHAHCKHGHANNCPDPGECEVVWPEGAKR